jgi:HSP20 family protein
MSERSERSVAPVGRRSPFTELELFEHLDPFGRHPRMRNLLAEMFGEGGAAARAFAPAVDVAENDEEYVISAELPGTKKDDVTDELHEGVLTLRGEKKSEREGKNEQARYVERSFGSFSRSFTLPSNADGIKLEASFRDGVLTIRVPKREEAKPRVIQVRDA